MVEKDETIGQIRGVPPIIPELREESEEATLIREQVLQ